MKGCNLYDSPAFDDVTGGIRRPGGFRITQRALEFCDFPKEAKLLDLGCGNGATVEYIEKNFPYTCSGIDLSPFLIEEGLKKSPGLHLFVGDVENIPFEDSTMDGILAECSFCLMKNKPLALKEIKRVLKPHGKLIISDMYIRDKRGYDVVKNSSGKNCFVNALIIEELEIMLENMGFEIDLFENHTNELKSMIGKMIMEYGSTKAFFEVITNNSTECENTYNLSKKLKLGYFLCVAKIKP